MIGISANSYDPNGSIRVAVRPDNPYQAERRGSITATLDGSVSVYDAGYSISDQTITATVRNPSRALLVMLQYLVAYYGQIILACETGVYSAVMRFSLSKNSIALSFRLTSRLDA